MYGKLRHASSMHENLNDSIKLILVYFITPPSVRCIAIMGFCFNEQNTCEMNT